jgi:nucleotide-binding universal stress UspA family protein
VESLMAAHTLEERLSQIVHAAGAKLQMSRKVPDGTTAATILAEAERVEADLLVVGASARSAWRLKRGTSCEVSSQARCAVLTVPDDVPATFTRRILLPVDFSVATEAALEWTILLARSFGSQVDVLHALRRPTAPPADASQLERPRLSAALTRLTSTVARLREAGVPDITSVVVEGDTLDAILARHQSEGSGLIVMANHAVTPSPRIANAAPGTIAWVRASLAVPVLSVRGQPTSANWRRQDLPERRWRDRDQRSNEAPGAPAAGEAA